MKRIIRSSFAALALVALTALPAHTQNKDIVDTAVGAGSFKTLAAALQAAGLVETLKGPARSPSSRPPTRPSRSCRPARSRTC
jgi:hypothetical protein